MELEPLDGYVDASGNQNTVDDKVLTVNGVLSTPELWNEFDREWQEFLKGKCWRANENGKYVFHATDFWADDCDYAPKGLSTTFKKIIYGHLLTLIKRYSLWRFGMAVLLDDLRNFEKEVPHAREFVLSKAGTMLSKLCFDVNSDWAARTNKYDPSITYVFESGDEWFGELETQFNTVRKQYRGRERELTVYALDDRPKDDYSPLQAADIIAWECRQYFLKGAKDRDALLAGKIKPRPELSFLHVEGESSFAIFDEHHIESHFQRLVADRLEGANIDPNVRLIGDGNPFTDLGQLGRHIVDEVKKLEVADVKARQAEARARYEATKSDKKDAR
jgi:hypothetical protein